MVGGFAGGRVNIARMTDWNAHLSARLDTLKNAGLQRTLRIAIGSGVHLEVGDRKLVSFASNDYLGLSAAAAQVAGASGATASRLICGTKPEHVELESALAQFKRTQAALVFPSGYHAALSVIQALVGSKNDEQAGVHILIDRLAHASLLDGAMLAKEWGGASARTFKHNDLEALKEKLDKVPQDELALVVTESLFSMDGDLAPLEALYKLTHKKGALLLVDEAHATGVLGPNGAGLLSEVFAGNDLPDDIVSMGTLSKALGSQGGFICASKTVIDTIIHSGRAFLFTTGLAPVCAAAGLSAVKYLAEGKAESARKRLLENSIQVRKQLSAQGWQVIEGHGPIIPVVIGDEARTLEIFNQLMGAGYWVPAIRFPTVARGQARLRISLSAAHEQWHLDALLAELKKLHG
jgi:8-amino-7-oxononanoate synthase